MAMYSRIPKMGLKNTLDVGYTGIPRPCKHLSVVNESKLNYRFSYYKILQSIILSNDHTPHKSPLNYAIIIMNQ